MTDILQSTLPFDHTNPRNLPGVQPLDPSDWIHVDDAFSGQMEERERLVRDHRYDVIALDDRARPAADELLSVLLDYLAQRDDYRVSSGTVLRPDGKTVSIDVDDPLGTLTCLVQNDFCILQKQSDEHVLTGACLCFPASWSLANKFMRPLVAIHDPVDSYDNNIAKRVQRLFDGLQVDRPLWRFNVLTYDVPTLHLPETRSLERSEEERSQDRFLRSERQTLVKLPDTQAVIFGIHTFVLRKSD
jgi:hypothetical protein